MSSVEDERYQLVDLPAASIPANQPGAPDDALKYVIGSSPRNLRATTLGRRVAAGYPKAAPASLASRSRTARQFCLPDRPLTGLSGSTTPALRPTTWNTCQSGARAFNASGRTAEAAREAMVEGTTQFFDLVGRMPAANRYELDFARALIEGEKLGQNGVTDLLVVSLSPNDIQGHQFGPDSDSEEQMILSLDRDLDGFNSWLDKTVGLKNVWLALSADHGIAPIPADAAQLGIHSAVVNTITLYAKLNTDLNARFTPGKKVQYLMPDPDLPYIVLDRRAFEKAGVSEKTAEDAVAALLPPAVAIQSPQPDGPLPLQHRLPPPLHVAGVYTRLEMAHGELPPTEIGRLLAHSYAEHGNWYVMLMLGAYQMSGSSGSGGTTHFSPWSYDRHVPLAFYGAPFLPGEYHERVAPVDLAATLASLAGINQPSAAVGRVLTEALKPTHAESAR